MITYRNGKYVVKEKRESVWDYVWIIAIGLLTGVAMGMGI